MAMAPPRPCAHPRCPNTATHKGRCAVHQRPSSFVRGYTSEWAEYSKAWLARFPSCGMRRDGQFHVEHSVCARRRMQVKARVVDHIVSLARGGSLMDPRNHQSLCVSCNTAKG
jgi:5-methylcytosine-specific restriction endonuclease McrA